MERLLDFSQPFDVSLFDDVVGSLFHGPDPQARGQANHVLTQFQEHDHAWIHSPAIIDNSSRIESKVIALNTLDAYIRKQWNTIEQNERENIKKFIINKIITICNDPEQFYNPANKLLINSLNKPLISILKHDWTKDWESFVQEMTESAHNSVSLCENNLTLLSNLCEDVFDFGSDWMTEPKKLRFKEQYTKDFELVFNLLKMILSDAQNTNESLVLTALHTLSVFIQWIPLDFIFKTNLIEILVTVLLPPVISRNDALHCLTQIAGLTLGEKAPEFEAVLIQLFAGTAISIIEFIPKDANLAEIYQTSSETDRIFLRQIGLFITTFLRTHLHLIEGNFTTNQYILPCLDIIVRLTCVDDKAILNIVLEFWLFLAKELFTTDIKPIVTPASFTTSSTVSLTPQPSRSLPAAKEFQSPFAPRMGVLPNKPITTPSTISNFKNFPRAKVKQVGILGESQKRAAIIASNLSGIEGTERSRTYEPTLHRVRQILIERMAPPEEIQVIVNEAGEIERRQTTNTDQTELYREMRETIIYLTHLNPTATRNLLLDMLTQQEDPTHFHFDALNSVCWSIGAIGGTMSKENESSFVFDVMRRLLTMVDTKEDRESRATIAANLMFVASQYPRFLQSNSNFLLTICNKLIQFMRENFPGVKDMATETFLKISRGCRRTLIETKAMDSSIRYLERLLQTFSDIVGDLNKQQVLNVFEAFGWIISAEKDEEQQQSYIAELFLLVNGEWSTTTTRLSNESNAVTDGDVLNTIHTCLTTATRTITPLKSAVRNQFKTLFSDSVVMYVELSKHINNAIASFGPQIFEDTLTRQMRLVRKQILTLFITFFDVVDDPMLINSDYLQPLIEQILPIYAQSPPLTRDADILSLTTVLARRLRSILHPHFHTILTLLFEPTIAAITHNFEDFPEQRLAFYQLLAALNEHCPNGLVSHKEKSQTTLIVDTILWGVKHADKIIADLGLDLLAGLITNYVQSDNGPTFFQDHYVRIFTDVLGVMTDSFHKQGFRGQCIVLHRLSTLLYTGQISVSLSPEYHDSNLAFMKTTLTAIIGSAFSHLLPVQIEYFIDGLFTTAELDRFSNHVRDFLIQLQEVAKDPTDLFIDDYLDECALNQVISFNDDILVPGLLSDLFADDSDDEYIFI
ncbi:putative exportin 1B [Blattamonas nauphoetae]|uniref:Exportin 1B n=1 Tax=Blattamonas nauphoetae TaxID=2049346 RepID=A0ABQ9YMD3_9EUKA|nr:putative exportin 1B [Blattamonas nauphoetae]